jgi:hypothetical protein
MSGRYAHEGGHHDGRHHEWRQQHDDVVAADAGDGNGSAILRDRSGYVTAMDVQTADGVQFVRFSPGMGSRLYTTYRWVAPLRFTSLAAPPHAGMLSA